jgi:type III secretion system FlhB-like substrate exporter
MTAAYKSAMTALPMEHQSGPTRAVGLAYDPQDGLPRVVFKAAGELAEQALEHGLRVSGPRVVRDGALLAQLYRLPVDGAIDASLFQAVATLLSHVLALNQALREQGPGSARMRDASRDGISDGLPDAGQEKV